jgi:hypothetical protein
MLVMGIASPIWMRAIDTAGTYLAQNPVTAAPAATSIAPASTVSEGGPR